MKIINYSEDTLIQNWCKKNGKNWINTHDDIVYFQGLLKKHRTETFIISASFLVVTSLIAILTSKNSSLAEMLTKIIILSIMSTIVFFSTFCTNVENPDILEVIVQFEKDFKILRKIQKNPDYLEIIEKEIKKADNVIQVFILSRKLNHYKYVMGKFGINQEV